MNYFQERLLSKENGNRDSHHPYDSIDYQGLNGKEIEFFQLVRKGNVDTIRERIRDGDNFNARAKDGITPLMIAVEYGFYEVVEEFLRCKADITAREVVDAESSGKGLTAMNLAARNKDRRMIELLLNYGGDINEKAGFDGESPFLTSVCSCDCSYMDFVLEKGANINIEEYNGKTGLIHAVLTEDKKLVAYLLDKGADINHRNITGLTALDIAKNEGLKEMVNFLVEAGATDNHRMVKHLVTLRQDIYFWDNDISFAYYHWSTEDGFSHFLVSGVGYINKDFALSGFNRFYIREKKDEFIETYAGDSQNWFHYMRNERGKIIDEKFNRCGKTIRGNIIDPNQVDEPGNSEIIPDPNQLGGLDLFVKYKELTDFLFNFVSMVEEKIDSKASSEPKTITFWRYSKNGWDFLGPSWERISVGADIDHVDTILDLLLKYYCY